jgi:uncharacterized membrane protein
MSKKRKNNLPVGNNRQANVVRTSEENASRRKPVTRSATTATRKAVAPVYSAKDMIFGRENYILMIGGLGLILIGFLLMRGGQMPDENTWEPSIIYSTTRITIAPILILLGLVLQIVAIFRKSKTEEIVAVEE